MLLYVCIVTVVREGELLQQYHPPLLIMFCNSQNQSKCWNKMMIMGNHNVVQAIVLGCIALRFTFGMFFCPDSGRKRTSQSQRDMDRIAGQVKLLSLCDLNLQ